MVAKLASLAEIDGMLIVDRALDYAVTKNHHSSPEAALASIGKGDVSSYLYFRYGLAAEAASQIARICDGIESAMMFLENRCEEFPGEPVLVGLIVERKTAALQSLAESICEAVNVETGKRIPALASFEILQIEVVDSQEVSLRKGLGALVQSINEPPIQVWPQQ